MLCFVSKKALAGVDLGPSYDHYPKSAQTVMLDKINQLERIEFEVRLKEDEPTILLPCAICTRTFTPQSLDKHVKICERAAAKKRKPFDSAKQRIQGTDLAEFIPKQEKKPRNYYEYRSSKPTSSWKQSHDDFLRAIRAARDNLNETSMQKQTNNVTSARGPTRANEKGVCPTCNRQFGIKAYDRHVIWCKERTTRLPISQATNAAKERLEARMKYRAPALKNRRAKNREKYSSGSTMSLNRTSKMALPTPNNLRLKETNSVPNYSKPTDVLVKQKSPITRRLEQQQNPSEHMKSLAVDRTNRPVEDHDSGSASIQGDHPTFPLNHAPYFTDCPKKSEKEKCSAEYLHFILQTSSKKRTAKPKINPRGKRVYQTKSTEHKNVRSTSPRKINIVLSRSQGNPKLNDVAVNYKIASMAIQPCSISKDDAFISCKEISQERRQVESEITKNDAICRNLQTTNFETSFHDNTERSIVSGLKIIKYNGNKETIGTRKKLSPLQTEIGKRSSTIDTFNQIRWNPVQHSLLTQSNNRTTSTQNHFACDRDLNNFKYYINFRESNTYLNNTIVAEQGDNEKIIKILKERQNNNNLLADKERICSKEKLKIHHEGKLKQQRRFEGRPFPSVLERGNGPLASHTIEIFQENHNNYPQKLLDESPLRDGRSVENTIIKKIMVSEKKHSNINSSTKRRQRLSEDHNERKSKRWSNEQDFAVEHTYVTDSELKSFELSFINVNFVEIGISKVKKHNKKPSLDNNDKLRTKDLTFRKCITEHDNNSMVEMINLPNLNSNDTQCLGTNLSKKKVYLLIKRETPSFTTWLQSSTSVRQSTDKTHTQGVKCIFELFRHLESFPFNKEACKAGINTNAVFVTNYDRQKRVVFNDQGNALSQSTDKKEKISIQEQKLNVCLPRHGNKLFLKLSVGRFIDYTLLPIISDSIYLKFPKDVRIIEVVLICTIAGLRITEEKKERGEQDNMYVDISSLFLVNKTRTKGKNNTYNATLSLRNSDRNILGNDYFRYIHKDRVDENNLQLCSLNLDESNILNFQQKIYILDFTTNLLLDFLAVRNVNHFVKFNSNVQFNFMQNNDPENKKIKATVSGNFDISPVINLNGENTTKVMASGRLRQINPSEDEQLPKISTKLIRNENTDKYNFHAWNNYSLSQNVCLNNSETVLLSTIRNEENYFTDLSENNEHLQGMLGYSARTTEKSNFLNENRELCICMNKSESIMDLTKPPDITIINKICKVNKHDLNQCFVSDNDSVLKDKWPRSLKKVKYPRSIKTITARLQKNLHELRCSAPSVESSELGKPFLARDPITDVNNLSMGFSFPELKKKLFHSMILLRGSTNALVSSTEAISVTNRKEDRALGKFYKRKTFKQIVVNDNQVIGLAVLPEIRSESQIAASRKRNPAIGNSACSKKALMFLKKRLINLDQLHQRPVDHYKRNFKLPTLSPVLCNTTVKKESGIRKDYDPFSLAEQQMNELLSDTSDSTTDGLTTSQTRKNLFPLSHSSAFVKYPSQEVTTPATTTTTVTDTRMFMIAPPTEFDDLISDFSSDSTETNSLSRETFINELKEFKDMQEFDKIYKEIKSECKNRSSGSKELGRRVIIDKSKVLGGDMVTDPSHHRSGSFVGSTEKARKILDKVAPKVVRPTTVNCSNLVRVCSAPKPTTKCNISDAVMSDAVSNISNSRFNEIQSYRNPILNNMNNNDVSLSPSNLCQNSILFSEVNIKRSNSVFDDLISSFEDNVVSFSSSGLHVKKDSLSMSSPIHGSGITHNGQISDEELSSPDSYQRQDHGKFNADSAYSSLNRRYSNQSAQLNGETTSKNNNRRASDTSEVTKSKMSNFCHECGSKFPKTAKYCCECGMKRLIL